MKCSGTAVSAKLGDGVRSRVSVGGGVYKPLVDLSLLLFKSPCLKIQIPKCLVHSHMAFLSSSSKESSKTTWSEDGDTTCSYLRGLLFGNVN